MHDDDAFGTSTAKSRSARAPTRARHSATTRPSCFRGSSSVRWSIVSLRGSECVPATARHRYFFVPSDLPFPTRTLVHRTHSEQQCRRFWNVRVRPTARAEHSEAALLHAGDKQKEARKTRGTRCEWTLPNTAAWQERLTVDCPRFEIEFDPAVPFWATIVR